MGSELYELIDARVNTITFESENYDSEFVLKNIPRHLKAAFRPVYFQEKKKEMLFLKRIIELIEAQDDQD